MAQPRVLVNLSIPARAGEAVKAGAEGVGLMRAEFLVYQTGRHPMFLLTDPHPRDLQTILADGMRTVARAFDPQPVLYRSMDLRSNEVRDLVGGADLEEVEENPALGCRGVNRSQRDADVFRAELAALTRVRAEGFPGLHLMLPFVRWPEEVTWARTLVAEAAEARGAAVPDVWMMAETPASILRAHEFAPLVDGVSIGSNDLSQLVLGLDRDNAAFSRQDWDQDPAVVAALRMAADRYKALGIPVGICGDAPSRSEALLETMMDWGLDSISVSLDRVQALHEILGRAESRGLAQA